MRLRSVVRLWDHARHNAFPDLIRHRERWYCVCREAGDHVSPEGAIRVLQSIDGEQWQAVALLRSPAGDLRDPRLSIAPDGRLCLNAAVALHPAGDFSHRSQMYFSADGCHWSEPRIIGPPGVWIWRLAWHQGRGYGVGYRCGDLPPGTSLYRCEDGLNFETLVPDFMQEGRPSETGLVFQGDQAWCLLRRDGEPSSALLGRAQAPFTDWAWQDLGRRIGGPQLLRLDDGRLLAGLRLLDGQIRTAVCWLDADGLHEALALPSGGDTSYPGMVVHQGELWLVYYSSHEGPTALYLARIQLADPDHPC